MGSGTRSNRLVLQHIAESPVRHVGITLQRCIIPPCLSRVIWGFTPSGIQGRATGQGANPTEAVSIFAFRRAKAIFLPLFILQFANCLHTIGAQQD